MVIKQSGFTLVELITVIILIGILAVTVLPKFDGTASYEAHAHRAQLIAALRLTQQRAMQQTDPNAVSTGRPFCHQIIFDNDVTTTRYGVPDREDCTTETFSATWKPDATGFEVDSKYQISFTIAGLTNPSAISFDSMGLPVANKSIGNNCAGGCIINVQTSVETLQIKIESEGYIHAI
ncbi:MAG: type II secretion system GspH family protein [Colwellia sp.]|nr:type II secretion system GspH family protein [Colwellia sp.]MCW8864965.1 type II secretion system GspH family protein [Colwellia sp.]MCW9082155.1 type II secretion system GspH family protein [Colwellia sp.]